MAKELEAYKDTMNKWAQRWEAKAGKSSIIAIKRRNFLKKKEISGVPCHREVTVRMEIYSLGLHEETNLTIISSNIFSGPFSLSSPSGTPIT